MSVVTAGRNWIASSRPTLFHSSIKLHPLVTKVTKIGEFGSDIIINCSEYSMLLILVVVAFGFWHAVISLD